MASDTSPFSVQLVEHKGLGLVARKLITRGTCILSEDALFHLHDASKNTGHLIEALSRLSPTDRKVFFNLPVSFETQESFLRYATYAVVLMTSAHPPVPDIIENEIRPGPMDIVLQGLPLALHIWKCNYFQTSELGGAIFLRLSQINHSCLANANFQYDEQLGRMRVFAQKDIRKGEEITIGYLASALLSRAGRNKALEEFGFSCKCDVCSLEGDEARESDIRRTFLGGAKLKADLYRGLYSQESVQTIKSTKYGPRETITLCEIAIKVLEKEGITGPFVGYFSLDIAEIRAELGHFQDAVKWMERYIEIEKACFGEDREDVRRAERRLEYLRARLAAQK